MACSLPEKDIITITFHFFWPGRQMRPLLLDSPKLVLPAHLFKQKSAQNFQSFKPGRWDFAGTHGEWSSLFVKGRGTFRLDGSQNFDGRSENPQRIKDELNILRKRRISTTSSYHGNRWSYTKTRTTKKRQNVYIPWCIPNIHRSILCFFFWKKQWMIHLDEAVGIREGGTAQCHGHWPSCPGNPNGSMGCPERKPLWLVKLGDGTFLCLVKIFHNFSNKHGNAVRYLTNDFTWDERKVFFLRLAQMNPSISIGRKAPKLVVSCWCKLWIVFFLGDLKVAIGFLESKWYRIEVMEIHRNSHIAAFMLAEEVSIDFCKDLTLSHVHRGWWLR